MNILLRLFFIETKTETRAQTKTNEQSSLLVWFWQTKNERSFLVWKTQTKNERSGIIKNRRIQGEKTLGSQFQI